MQLYATQYVALGGGAMHGLMYLGVLIAAFQNKRSTFEAWRTRVRQFAGASMGALLAALLTVWSPWDVWMYTKTDTFQRIAHGMFDQSWSAVAASHSISSGAALDAGLRAGVHEVFGSADVTLADVFARTGKQLVIVVTNLSTRKAEYWSHVTRPTMQLWLALRASMSLPAMFPAVRIGEHTFCDGGVTCNVPCHLTPPARTLTLLIHTPMRDASWGVLPCVWDSLMGASQLGSLRAQPLYAAGLVACAACDTTPSAYNFSADDAAIDEIVLQGMRAWGATLLRAACILVTLRETLGDVAARLGRRLWRHETVTAEPIVVGDMPAVTTDDMLDVELLTDVGVTTASSSSFSVLPTSSRHAPEDCDVLLLGLGLLAASPLWKSSLHNDTAGSVAQTGQAVTSSCCSVCGNAHAASTSAACRAANTISSATAPIMSSMHAVRGATASESQYDQAPLSSRKTATT